MPLGPPADLFDFGCSYTGATADGPVCGVAPVTHFWIAPAAGVSACATHAPIVRATCRVVREHEHGGPCGMPGALWMPDENVCVIDASGVEPELSGRVGDRHAYAATG